MEWVSSQSAEFNNNWAIGSKVHLIYERGISILILKQNNLGTNYWF